MSITDRMMKACTLSKWQGCLTKCRWCDTPLSGRQKRWCSPICGDEAFTEHYFASGRKRALARDNRTCVRCGIKGNKRKGIRIEVNHKNPALGTHGKAGCQHHTSELEVMCRPCHLLETKRQRLAGEFKR